MARGRARSPRRSRLELTRFRGHPMVGAERSIHDAEEPWAVPTGVPATPARRSGTIQELRVRRNRNRSHIADSWAGSTSRNVDTSRPFHFPFGPRGITRALLELERHEFPFTLPVRQNLANLDPLFYVRGVPHLINERAGVLVAPRDLHRSKRAGGDGDSFVCVHGPNAVAVESGPVDRTFLPIALLPSLSDRQRPDVCEA